MKQPDFNIYYEDDDLIVCHKPAGIAVQTARLGEADMESILKNYLAGQGKKPWIGVVHRLDQPVEGVMVFAKHAGAAASLSEQMRQHGIGKHYYAVTERAPEQREGTLVHFLRFDRKGNRSEISEAKLPDSKRAELSYRILGEADGRYLWDIDLKTGRHHQIRAQLAYIGCPIVGDRKYGTVHETIGDRKYGAAQETVGDRKYGTACEAAGNWKYGAARETARDRKYGTDTPALCSYALEFTHPTNRKKLSFTATPAGEAFCEFFKEK